MAITAARIEASGWVLAITCTGSLGSFASYTLDPDGTPRVSFTTAHGGFVKSSGTAATGTITRTIVGTKPLRQAVNRASPTVEVIDETDLGGGSIRVRIALSENIYATDTVGTLSVLSGWRSGESAASGISITNSSALAAPIPVMRWADLQYERRSGSWQLALLVASHHPVGFEPVAGVKFTATDGTTVKTYWATELGWHGTAPDRLRCYTVTVDPSTATALTAGLIRCDAEIYPWLGSMRTTDASGTRTMTGVVDLGRQTSAQSPFMVGYDFGTSVYAAQFVYVDPASTNVTAASASAGMVATSVSGAKAVTLANRAGNVAVALQALQIAARTLPAANGQASATRSADGAVIVLAAGVNVVGAAVSVSTGLQTPQLPVQLVGDPDDSDPRTNCILRSGTATNGSLRATRFALKNLSCEIGQVDLLAPTFATLENVKVRGKTGYSSSATATLKLLAASGYYAGQARNVKWWRTGSTMAGVNNNFGMVRNVQCPSYIAAQAIFNCRLITNAEDGVYTGVGRLTGSQNDDVGAQSDVMWAYNDMRGQNQRILVPPFVSATALGGGATKGAVQRWVLFNNLIETVTNASSEALASIGEDELAAGVKSARYNIIEGNSTPGGRVNFFYNDPEPVTLAEVDTIFNESFGNRIANNAFALKASKQDDFADPTAQSVRIANSVTPSEGYRPHLIQTWSDLYGVGYEGNYDGRTTTVIPATNFQHQYFGRRSVQSQVSQSPSVLWTSDRSLYGTGAGGGDYTPVASSPLLGRVARGNSDVDWAGTARRGGGAAGAIEASVGIVSLVPAGSRSLQAAGVGVVAIGFSLGSAAAGHRHAAAATVTGWRTALAVASGRSIQTAGVAGLTIRLALVAANSGHRHAAAPTVANWAAALAPGRAMQRLASHSPAVSNGFAAALLPDDGALQINPGQVMLFPDRPLAGIVTLSIPADLRTFLVN